jgi:hypothetical protein
MLAVVLYTPEHRLAASVAWIRGGYFCRAWCVSPGVWLLSAAAASQASCPDQIELQAATPRAYADGYNVYREAQHTTYGIHTHAQNPRHQQRSRQL